MSARPLWESALRAIDALQVVLRGEDAQTLMMRTQLLNDAMYALAGALNVTDNVTETEPIVPVLPIQIEISSLTGDTDTDAD